MEIWRDIPNYEGLYQVSNFGNVRSLNWGNRGFTDNLYLKPHNRGYLQVELHRNGSRKMFTVHRLVAVSFVDGYRDGLMINHKDENKTNNRATNLEWVTSSDNVLHSISHRSNAQHRTRKRFVPRTDIVPVFQFDLSGDLIKTWDSSISVKEELGFSDWSIKQCCRGNRKSAYGYKWQYAT